MSVTIGSANPVQDVVLDAIESATPLRIAGRSHWMDAGRPVEATRVASLATHAGVVDYVPGDLTITVRSGTTLHDIQQITGAEGQYLPLDPYGNSDGSVGATIATGSFGPHAHGFGRVRDLVLGLEFVTGDGKLVRGGGRVVKNVAGFDLVRLATGSWGTIGIVTEATLRLYSVPRHSCVMSLDMPHERNAISSRIAAILSSPVSASVIELIDASVSRALGLQNRPQVIVVIGGNAAAVNAQREVLLRLGNATQIEGDVVSKFRLIEDEVRSPSVIRVSCQPARFGELWSNLSVICNEIPGSMMHATPSLGIVRCIIPADTTPATIREIGSSGTGVVYERLPHEMWTQLSPSVVSDRISQGIMRAFNPSRLLNPGILGPMN